MYYTRRSGSWSSEERGKKIRLRVSSDNYYLPLCCRPARLTLSLSSRYPVPIKILLSGGPLSTACRILRHSRLTASAAQLSTPGAADGVNFKLTHRRPRLELESPRPHAEPILRPGQGWSMQPWLPSLSLRPQVGQPWLQLPVSECNSDSNCSADGLGCHWQWVSAYGPSLPL